MHKTNGAEEKRPATTRILYALSRKLSLRACVAPDQLSCVIQMNVLEGSAARSGEKSLELWSGLSESNRHLNLGKVPKTKSNTLERRQFPTDQAGSIRK